MSAKQRSLGERHPICQERPAQSLTEAGPLSLSCLLLPPFPSHPPPPQAGQDSLFSLLPSPVCPPLSPQPPGWGSARPGLSLLMRSARIQKRLQHLPGARLPLTPDLARGPAIRSVSASRRPPWSPRDTSRTLVAALFFPASLPRPSTLGGGRAELAFFFSNRGALCLLSIPLPLSRVYTGLRGRTESSPSRFPFVSSRMDVLERWGLGIQIPRAIYISNLILQPPALQIFINM